MENEKIYGNLLEAFGEELRHYSSLEHERGHGEGKVVLDPDMGGYNNRSSTSPLDLVVEASKYIYQKVQGVERYEVEGTGDKTVEEAVEEIIGDTLPQAEHEELVPSSER